MKSLEQKLDDELNKKRFTNSSLKELMVVAVSSTQLSLFFKELGSNLNLKKLTFLHRVDLFGMDKDVHIPYLHLCSIPKNVKRGIGHDQISKTLQHIVANEIESTPIKAKDFMMKNLGISDEMGEDAKDIFAYLLIDFLRNNPSIVTLAQAPDFNYALMKSTLGDYKTSINFNLYFSHLITNYADEKMVDQVIAKKTEKLLLGLVSNFMLRVDESLEQVSNLTPDIMMMLHKSSVVWIGTLLTKIKLKYENYIETLQCLYRCNLIENRSIMTWCPSCSVESPTFSSTTGKVSPEKFMKARKCLTCSNKELFSSIYGINKDLREMIFAKDGILPVYFCWLLEKSNIQYETGKYVNEFESDILIKNSILVESKMLKVEKDDEAVQASIDKAVKQLENQITAFKAQGIEIKKAYLLWNRENLDEETWEKTKRKHQKICKDYKFGIISLNDIEAAVNEIAEV